MSDYNLIIIGAGAAGLMCAANIRKGISTLILEKTTKIGTKLKISGSGQCNITHSGDIKSFERAYGKNGRFLRSALHSFSNEDLVEYFSNLGVPIIEREDGKMFPESLKSGDIISALTSQIKKSGHEIIKDSKVTSISFDAETKLFSVNSSKGIFTAENIVISTGGASYPRTGSTGDGYRFAQDLGHNVVKTSPSLVPVSVKNWKFRKVAGNSFKNASITVKNGKKKITSSGELLITHEGLSGPLILDFSRFIDEEDTVCINFLANLNTETVFEKLTGLFKSSPSKKISRILTKLELPAGFCLSLLDISGISPEKLCGSVSKAEARKIAENLCSFKVEVKKDGYEKAMCTAGGVNLKEVDQKTMESRIAKGLYFCGEVLDIDGNTGGYNIQAAFSTAFSTATAICNKY